MEVDQALATFRQFKGKCTNCSKFGHKSSECCSKSNIKNNASTDKKKSKNLKNKEKGSDRNDKSHIQCFNCREMGHYQLKCPHNKLKKGSVKLTEKDNNTVLMTVGQLKAIKNGTWIANLATSTHIVNSKEGHYNCTVICKPVKIGDGKLVSVMKVKKLRVHYEKEGREQVKFILDNVQYTPNFWVNLFSFMAAITKNCTISNKGQTIIIEKNSLILKFNDEIKVQNGFICRLVLQVKPKEDFSFAAIGNQVSHDINDLHHRLVHALEPIA